MDAATYVAGRPHPGLAGLVRAYGGYREHSAIPVRRREAPNGACTLVLGLGPPIRLHGPAGPVVPGSFLAGMHDAAVVTEFVGAQAGVQVDVTPLGVFMLLGQPMTDLTNQTPSVEALGVPALARLPEQLAAQPTWAGRFALVDDALVGLLAASRARPAPEVAWAWDRLVQTAGRTRVHELADRTGWSRRNLLTRFREQIGLAPKTAARVLRFERAARLLVPQGSDVPLPGGPPSIADVAARCGYADQAHLVREFRALAGVTPSDYLRGWRAALPIRSIPG